MAIENVLAAPQGFAGAYGSVDETFGLAKQGVIVLFSTMSKVAFQLSYDGPALRDGTMDVNELAVSLTTVGDLLQEANRRQDSSNRDAAE